MTLDGAMGPLIVLLISVLVIRWLMLRGRFSDLERQVKELASARDESVSLRANLVQRVFALEQERKKTAVPEQTPARAVAKELAREAPAPGAPAAEITPLSVASAESAPAPPVEAPTAILGAAPWLEPLAIPDVQAAQAPPGEVPFRTVTASLPTSDVVSLVVSPGETPAFRAAAVEAAPVQPVETPKIAQLEPDVAATVAEASEAPPQKLAQRIAYTTSIAKGKQSRSAPTPISDPPYAAIVERAVRYNIQADIDNRRFRTAVAHAQHLVDLHPADPEDTFLLAEAYRALGPRTAEPSDKNLTRRGKAHARMELMRRTPEEEENELLSRPDGRRSRQANQEKAEGLYAKVQAMNTSYANVYRGLGLLYEDQGNGRKRRRLMESTWNSHRTPRRVYEFGGAWMRSTRR